MVRCKECHKPVKENTLGDPKYCQGHSILNLKNVFVAGKRI